MTDLTSRRILVAGGTGNIGRHVVEAVLTAGGVAIVPSRSTEKLKALVRGREPAVRARLVPLRGDITDEAEAEVLLARAGRLDGAVASLGSIVLAPRMLSASLVDLRRAFDGHVGAHFAVARAVIPVLERSGGAFVTINGPLAFEPLHRGGGPVSVAAAAQAMLARVLMKELADGRVRVNEVVIYSSIGRGKDDRNEVTGADIGRYVAYLLSPEAAGIRGRTLHLAPRIPPTRQSA